VKHRFIYIPLFLILLTTPVVGLAQETEGFNLLKDDIEMLLPPLQAIIDSALAKNPDVKAKDLQIKINEFKLKSERMRWSENLGFQTDMRYGTFDNFSTNTAAGQSPAVLATRNNQLNYGVGAYVKIPLYDFLNHRSLIGASKAEVEQAASVAEVQRDALRQIVIKQYQELILKQKLLRIKSKYLETSRIDVAMAEKAFQNGLISVAEYSRISAITATTEVDFETSKNEFSTAFMILEEIAKTKFKLTKK